jgi:hypothetical protein
MTRILIGAFVACLLASVCFGQTWGTLNVDLIVSMNTSTPGTPLTDAIANAGTVSNVCTVGSSCTWASVPSDWTVGANQNIFSNLGSVQMNGTGGTLYQAQSLKYNAVEKPDSNNSTIVNMNFSPSIGNYVSVLAGFTLGTPQQSNGNDTDYFMIQDGSGYYAVLNQSENGSGSSPGCPGLSIRIEDHTAKTSPNICLVPQQSYYMSETWDRTAGVACLWVWTPQGTPVTGSPSCETTVLGSGTIQDIRIFSNENETDTNNTFYQNITIRWTTAQPNGTATFNGTTTVTGTGFPTNGSWNGAVMTVDGAFYTIASVQSSTQLTLATATSTSGSASYTIELPLFWANGSGSATLQPPTKLNAAVQ